MVVKSKLSKLINNKKDNDYYIIAETAHNHEGDLDYLCRAINEINDLDVDAIKIHMNVNLSSYASKDFSEGDVYDKFIWSKDQYGIVIDMIKEGGKDVVVLANDIESLDYLIARGDIDAIELHQVSLYDVCMLNRLKDYSGVVVLGVGGTEIDEIARAIELINIKKEKDVLLIYGFQSFPSQPEDINLNKMNKIKRLFGCEVGYADHTSHDHPYNAFVSTLGYAMGNRVVEKHYTPDPGVKRIDYESSVGKKVFKEMDGFLNIIQDAMGSGILGMSKKETSYGQYGVMKKAIVASQNIAAGTKISEKHILFKRTSIQSTGRQSDYDKMLGMIAIKSIAEDEMIDFSQLKDG